jgi:hypothetical protein
MESSIICTLYLEPVLNKFNKCYQNILTVSNIPNGPLAKYIQRVGSPRLSEFQTLSSYSPAPSRSLYSQMCLLALSRTEKMGGYENYMYAEDIPTIIGFLESNGYKIMTDMTNLAYRGSVDFATASTYGQNRRFVFMFKYEGP